MPYAFGYGRISTSEDRQIYSPAAQEKHCLEAWPKHPVASQLPWGGFYFDPEISGGTNLCERKAGHALNMRMEKDDWVFISRTDRAFRSLRDQVCTYEAWTQRGVKIVFINLALDTTTPEGELSLNIMGAVATWERRVIGQRITDGFREKKSRGLPKGDQAPIGWKVIGRKIDALFYPDEKERKFCAMLHAWLKSGDSCQDIADKLERGNYHPLQRHLTHQPKDCPRARKKLWSHRWVERACRAFVKGFPCSIADRRKAYLREVAPERVGECV